MRKLNIPEEKKYFYFFSFLLFITMLYVGHLLNQIGLHMYVNRINSTSIQYEEFRKMKLPASRIKKVKKDTDKLEDLTISMLINDYELSGKKNMKKRDIKKLVLQVSKNKTYQELKKYYYEILNDIKYFPVPLKENGEPYVTFEDSWYADRNYGGARKHEGTDLIPEYNVTGLYPIISITDGVVEKIGWLEKGGYRIGIRSSSGAYFYYAHLDSYAEGIEEGDEIKAGQLLGLMGDSGYGPEGTTGMFAVHLHLGIYIDTPAGELSVNPYYILLYLQSQ
ncbi:MAG: M23 family metallopeptidase [Anaerocolumna aminovalerica]|jgi:murein DD-endopeptidase MepM/ murein hydrolase activator NlpD|uniref:M23 family metallopeptidase n=1 Tax=Anaerocolumna aminovalerica TaxID=1527 RepID=UPI00248D0896|nr:M23 family metallopeptidase [Anaerocolumna aminovalerica]MDU6263828.1 M23 family metallopeptidase [Anaerocolumna aminovalerica]